MGKVRHVVVVTNGTEESPIPVDELRIMEVMRTLLYGTRLSRAELVERAGNTVVPIPVEDLEKLLGSYKWRISKGHPRLRLKELDEELVQAMAAKTPRVRDGEPVELEQFFERTRRLRVDIKIPKEMLMEKAMEDANLKGLLTIPDEAQEFSAWLERLATEEDPRIIRIFRDAEQLSTEKSLRVLNPRPWQVKQVLETLVAAGKLESQPWFKEIGRAARAYFPPGKAQFLDQRCGQCAFYVSVRRRCRLWWLVNKKYPFFDERWKQGGIVSTFEVHKMKYGSRIGPHSSACTRFVDKKRDHLRKAIPENCETCGELISARGTSVTCPKCKTKYVRFRDEVKVMTAYEHHYERLYQEIAGGDAKDDLEAWKQTLAERTPEVLQRRGETEDLDMLADEIGERETESPRVWPSFDQALQERVDQLAKSRDMARQFSVAMVQSAINATNRIPEIVNLDSRANVAVALQEKYLALIKEAPPTKFLPYEAMAMRHYWFCYNLAVKTANQWFGPRKRSRFVREFVEDPAGRARGYSAIDAAINYLHQRRLRRCEQINMEVGFRGTCDGFLHRNHYHSRRIGLVLDMIDPFKFADREELLVVVLKDGISWRDFRAQKDRRGSTFYYPSPSATNTLDRVGAIADNQRVLFGGLNVKLEEAYRLLASNLLYRLNARDSDWFEVFFFPEMRGPTPSEFGAGS